MTLTLVYNLPEEEREARVHLNAVRYKRVLEEVQERTREMVKHRFGEGEERETAVAEGFEPLELEA